MMGDPKRDKAQRPLQAAVGVTHSASVRQCVLFVKICLEDCNGWVCGYKYKYYTYTCRE